MDPTNTQNQIEQKVAVSSDQPPASEQKLINRWVNLKQLGSIGVLLLIVAAVPFSVQRALQNTYQPSFAKNNTVTMQLITGVVLAPAAISGTAVSFGETYQQVSPTDTCPRVDTSKNTTIVSLQNTARGSYRLWLHVMEKTKGAEPFYVQIDDQCPMPIYMPSDTPPGTPTWVTPRSAGLTDLPPNLHSIKIIGNGSPKDMDTLIMTTNTTCSPADNSC